MNRIVILSEAKDHLATLDPLEMILRFAQDDMLLHPSRFEEALRVYNIDSLKAGD